MTHNSSQDDEREMVQAFKRQHMKLPENCSSISQWWWFKRGYLAGFNAAMLRTRYALHLQEEDKS